MMQVNTLRVLRYVMMNHTNFNYEWKRINEIITVFSKFLIDEYLDHGGFIGYGREYKI